MEVSILLFDNFETLDAFGPVEILGKIDNYVIKYYSLNGGIIVSAQNTPIVTERSDIIPPNNLLVIPGGIGTRELVDNKEFINKLKVCANESSFCLTICTGSALLAKTGLLNGIHATSNKKAFDWVKSVNENVDWIRKARWVVDGKFYTSSGVSAGMDMTLGFIRDQFSEQLAKDIANHIEYIWYSDSSCDLFV
ncbi:MAG: dimethyladenosine transferase [Anaerocolumna sp.]|jgi:putative intracellular protease/amidase|nr:dimethyladenosine transferase [Anaerocolumna sp.]